MEKSYLETQSMTRSYFKWIIALAAVCVLIVSIFMWDGRVIQTPSSSTQTVPRPLAPFDSYISAVGIVEASGGNIYVGSPVNRVVDTIEVVVGQKVKKGEVLFRLEAPDLNADLASREIEYENAQANLNKLEALPREEDIVSSTAQLNSAQVELAQAKSQYQRVEGLQNSGAMSDEEVARRRFAFEEAEAKVQQALANLDKIKAGAWPPDVEISRLQVKLAQASVKRVEADIERTIIRSPIDATVLQIKIHEGEFPPSDYSRTPAVIIGNTDTMNLRVSINQFDVSYYNSSAPAVAFLQGNSEISFPLKFVHIEPFFVTKQNLNNDITEKVDTRVLQAIYCFEGGESRVFVGQQMDVFIQANFAHRDGP